MGHVIFTYMYIITIRMNELNITRYDIIYIINMYSLNEMCPAYCFINMFQLNIIYFFK